MTKTDTPDKNRPPIHERVARKFSFLTNLAFILLFIAVIVSIFK